MQGDTEIILRMPGNKQQLVADSKTKLEQLVEGKHLLLICVKHSKSNLQKIMETFEPGLRQQTGQSETHENPDQNELEETGSSSDSDEYIEPGGGALSIDPKEEAMFLRFLCSSDDRDYEELEETGSGSDSDEYEQPSREEGSRNRNGETRFLCGSDS